MLHTIFDKLRNEPAILNATLALLAALALALVDVLEATGSTWAGIVALVVAQAVGTRTRVTPV